MTVLKRAGLEISFELLGPADGEVILLLAGNGCNRMFWPDEFCRPFVARGYGVVRCDYRDTGASTHREFAAHPYTLDDLETDALALLDHLGVAKAHLVGLSMGGFLAQRLAIHHPQRVRSLISMMSTPDYDTMLHKVLGTDAPRSGLPPPDEAWFDSMKQIPAGLGTVALYLEAFRLANGTVAPFELDFWRPLLQQAAAYGEDEAAADYHRRACLSSTERNQCEALTRVTAPCLFIQGSEDPIFPPAHAEASARLVPGGRCLLVDGMGHALGPSFFPQLTHAMLDFLAAHGVSKS